MGKLGNSKKFFIIGFILSLFLPLIIFFFTKTQDSITYNIQKMISKSQGSATTVENTQFIFISKLPNISIKSESVNTFFLTKALSNLGLFPFKNLPYIGSIRTKIASLSPEIVEVHFLPLEDYEKNRKELEDNDKVLQNITDQTGTSIVRFVAGDVKNNGKKVEIPIYVNTNLLLPAEFKEKTLNGYALMSLYYTFHTPPLSVNNSDPGVEYMMKIGVFQDLLFQIQEKSQSFLLIKEFFIPKIHAQCAGTGQCGQMTNIYACSSGPYSGQGCNPATGLPCPGSCNSTPTCSASGGPVACGALGAMCTPGCGSCQVSASCTGSPQYCDRSGPNTIGCTDTNIGASCTNLSGVSGSCQVSSGGNAAECICATGGGGGGGPTNTPASSCNNNGSCGAGETTANCPNDCPAPTAAPTSPPGCNCGAWANGACQSSGCGDGYRGQTRSCNPANCSNQTQCIYDAACTLATPTPNSPPPACVVDLCIAGDCDSTYSTVAYNATIGPITWNTSNCNLCTASATSATGGWLGNKLVGNQSQAAVGPFTSTRTLTLSCTGPGGNASDSIVVPVNAAVPAAAVTLTVNGSSGPLFVNNTDILTVAWNVSNATSCTASATAVTPNWSGAVDATTGSHSLGNVGPATTTRTLTITCNGPGGAGSDSVVVNLTAANPVEADLKINGSDGPLYVPSGQTVSADWTVANATAACTASSFAVATTGWSGSKNQSGGSQSGLGPITSARTLRLFCTGNGGTSIFDDVVINLAPTPTPTTAPAPAVDLKANGQDSITIVTNSSVTMNWDAVNANACTAQTAVATGNWVNGSAKTPGLGQSQANVGPIATSRTLSLSCTNISGIASVDNVAITVATPTLTPAANQCSAPPPRDPPITDCATNIADTVDITWQWAPVAVANQYEIRIVNNLGVVILTSGVKPAAFFNCASGTCSFVTSLLRGTYRSAIQASNSSNHLFG